MESYGKRAPSGPARGRSRQSHLFSIRELVKAGDGHPQELPKSPKKASGVTATVWTHPKTSLTERDIATFNVQYPTLAVRHTASFHDRFLILDGAEGYLIGASLKDAGKKGFAITKLEDSSIIESIIAALGE